MSDNHYSVLINSVKFSSSVTQDIAIDFCHHKAKQYRHAGKRVTCQVIDNETDRVVFIEIVT